MFGVAGRAMPVEISSCSITSESMFGLNVSVAIKIRKLDGQLYRVALNSGNTWCMVRDIFHTLCSYTEWP